MEIEELKQKIEALLFSSGKKMLIQEISALARAAPDQVKEALIQLKGDYELKNSSLMIIEDGDFWKITVKEKHLELVRKIVTQTELTKTVMETLAIIAWKAPCIQSDIIKIRTNKAYDHVKELEADGYVLRAKKGRSMLIRLAPKFYDYFDIPQEKVKEVFSRFSQLEKQIIDKENEAEVVHKKIKEIEEAHKKQKKAMEEMGNTNFDDLELTAQEIVAQDLIAEENAKADSAAPKIEIIKEKLGDLEVVDTLPEEQPVQNQEEDQPAQIEETFSMEEAEERTTRQLPENIEKKVNKRVKEIVSEDSGSSDIEDSDLEETNSDMNEADSNIRKPGSKPDFSKSEFDNEDKEDIESDQDALAKDKLTYENSASDKSDSIESGEDDLDAAKLVEEKIDEEVDSMLHPDKKKAKKDEETYEDS